MRKKQSSLDRDVLIMEPPLFICQDRQCSGPMMTRVYVPEGSHSLEDRGEPEDLRENITVKKRTQ
jgi:hypothetical protein